MLNYSIVIILIILLISFYVLTVFLFAVYFQAKKVVQKKKKVSIHHGVTLFLKILLNFKLTYFSADILELSANEFKASG